MTTNNQLTFQPGKFYRTRDGRKARYIGLFAGQIYGAVWENDNWCAYAWHDNGKSTYGSRSLEEHPGDLIAEWSDTPSVDWSKMPAWANWVARSGTGSWWWFESKPIRSGIGWAADGYGRIADKFEPTWSGDWRESLVTRPTEETK